MDKKKSLPECCEDCYFFEAVLGRCFCRVLQRDFPPSPGADTPDTLRKMCRLTAVTLHVRDD